jgi:hypothetical protein
MKVRAWKILAGISLAVVVLTVILGLIMKTTITDAGIYDIHMVNDYLEACKTFQTIGIDSVQKDAGEDIESQRDYYLKSVTEDGAYVHYDLQVFVVEALDTGIPEENMLFNRGSCMSQYVKVVKVLQGDDIEGQYIDIYAMQGIISTSDDRIVNTGAHHKNAMLPGNQYLVFCEPMENMKELSTAGGCDLKYREIYSLFGRLCISQDFTALLQESPEDTDWKNVEFFAYHQETLDALLEIKHEILERYDIHVGDCY